MKIRVGMMVKRSENAGMVEVRDWILGLLAFVATGGTVLSTILLLTIVPVKDMAEKTKEDMIRNNEQHQEIIRRLERSEDMLETLQKMQSSIDVIKNDIEYLKKKE
jgi:hypothetical protein